MVSLREIRRIFEEEAPERQLPMSAIIEFQTRAEQMLHEFARLCDSEAGGESSNARLTKKHVKVAFVDLNDRIDNSEEEKEEEEFGEWNE